MRASCTAALVAVLALSCDAPPGELDASLYDAGFASDAGPALPFEPPAQEPPMFGNRKRWIQAAVLTTMVTAAAVTRIAVDQPPTFTAPIADVSGATSQAIAISGSCTDDGKPAPPGAVAYRWNVDSNTGAASCNVASPNSASTTVSSSGIGTCNVTLTCCDNVFSGATCTGQSASDTLVATITFRGVLDDIADAGGSSQVASWASTTDRLGGTWTGNLIRLRRADNVESNFTYASATNRLDFDTVEAFCGSSDCFLMRAYDQTGNGRDWAQTTAANQPKFYDGATQLPVLIGALPCPLFDGGAGGAGNGDYLTNATAHGITGASGATLWWFGKHDSFTSPATYNRIPIQVGALASNARLEGLHNTTQVQNFAASSTHRDFSYATTATNPAYWTYAIGAGAQMGTSVARQNGTSLTQVSVTGGTNTITFQNTASSIGARSDGSLGMSGKACTWAVFNTDISGAVLTAVQAYGANLLDRSDDTFSVLDSITATGAATALAAVSPSTLLRSAHGVNPIITIRRANDGATKGIPWHALRQALHTALIATFCASTDCFVVTEHDQSGNGRDYTQATASAQPKIWDASTGLIKVGNLPVTLHAGGAGTPGTADWWSRADQLGVSGKPSLTVLSVLQHTSIATFDRTLFMLGGTANRSYQHGVRTNGDLALTFLNGGYATRSRSFTPPTSTGTLGYEITQYISGSNVNTTSARWDGVLAPQSAVSQQSLFAIEGNTSGIGATADGSSGFTGYLGTTIIFGEVLSGDALEALVAFGDAQKVQAGGSVGAHDLTGHEPFYLGITGQSNASLLLTNGILTNLPANYYNVAIILSAASGTGMNPNWLPPSGTEYVAMVAAWNALDKRLPLAHWRIQGETDAGQDNSNAPTCTGTAPYYSGGENACLFAVNERTMFQAVTTDTAIPLCLINSILHEDAAPSHPNGKALVNNGKAANNTFFAPLASIFDPSPLGDLAVGDDVHWSIALENAAVAAVLPLGRTQCASSPRRKKKRRELQRPDRRGWLRTLAENDNSEAEVIAA